MAGGERPSTEDDRWDGFMKGMRSVDAIERDEHEFKPGAPAQPPPIAPRVAVQDQWSEPIDMVKGALVSAGDNNTNRSPLLVHEHGHLADIAELLGALTFGEMIELAAEIWGSRGDGDITVETLPTVLHKWSTRAQRGLVRHRSAR